MPNLLSKTALTTVTDTAELYVVYNKKDYRMTLATLLTLVTKGKLGLDKVDNTTDNDKPVSSATAQELAKKADLDSVPTLESFNSLSSSLAKYITQEKLDSAIKTVTDSLNSYQTSTQVSESISTALTPISESISSISTSLAEQITKIQNLQNASSSYADKDIVSALQEQLSVTNQTLDTLSTALTNHTHSASSISGLSELVSTLIQESTGTVVIGPDQW